MKLLDDAQTLSPWMQNIRRDIHKHPELGFEEHRTAALVEKELRALGLDVETGIGGTGIVATLKHGTSNHAIGLRADLDALPMDEKSGKDYASIHDGVFHGCGHDGHTAMLLGAARALAARPEFDGIVHFIFQPAEENLGGAKAMIEDGLFKRFPCENIFGLHNWPDHALGEFGVRPGPQMAAFATLDIEITGKGGHAALPHTTIDPVVIASELVQSLQTIVSRVIDPVSPAVVSVTQIHGGSAYNVIPDTVKLAGCCRYFSEADGQTIETEIRRRAETIAAAAGARADIRMNEVYTVLVNDAEQTDICASVASALVGADKVDANRPPIMASEDFAFMLKEVPGCYILMGTGGPGHGCMVHNPAYDFNDDALAIGASYWIELVRTILPAQHSAR